MTEPLFDDLDVRSPGKQPGGMCVPEPVHRDGSGQPARFDGGKPDVGAEPPARDVPVGHDRPASPRLVLPDRAASGAVRCVCAPAVLTPAFASGVGAEGAVPVTPPGVVRLGETQCSRVG